MNGITLQKCVYDVCVCTFCVGIDSVDLTSEKIDR